MSTINFKKCDNCGTIRDARDVFCGTCGKQFGSSGENYTTPPLDFLQQAPITPTVPAITQRSHRPNLIAIAVLVIMLISAGVLVGTLIGKNNSPAIIGNTLTPSTSNQSGTTPANTTTTIVSTPTLTSTPTPIPSPTAVSPGTVLCDTANPGQGWDNWNLVTGWKVLNGELLYDGTGNGEKLVAPASCQPTTPNYAVDVRMRIVSGCCHFGIIIRGGASTNGYTGYQLSIYTTTYQNIFISTLGGNGGAGSGYSFDNNFHIWRAEVKGNVINFVVDGGKVLSLTDNTYIFSPGEVSICCTDTMQLEITSFKITAL